MSVLKGMSIPEKIVWLFEHRATEAHRSAIERPLGISEEQFDAAIPRARDLGIEVGLRITPIYERDGWWTADPTRRIAAVAVKEAVTRNLGEAERNVRVYQQFGHVGESAGWVKQSLYGAKALMETNLPELGASAASDYVLERVDAALAVQRGFVPRELAEAA